MSYLPTSADNAFLLFDVLKADEQLQRLPAHAATDQALMQQVLEEAGKAIKAPIVGVFYAAASPGSAPYAPIGKKVKKVETVCIIEAMKCMNEIQAEEDGEIVEVLANDGDLVEYGQPLFKIK